MKFMDTGDYTFDERALEVSAEHDNKPCRVIIPVEVFREQFGATISGDFHEYWSLVQQHREVFEKVAERQIQNGQPNDGGKVVLENSHFDAP